MRTSAQREIMDKKDECGNPPACREFLSPVAIQILIGLTFPSIAV